jgi:flagellar motility protein MotE (MotC chaperone)
MLVKYSEQTKLETIPMVEVTDEIIDELSTEAGKKEKEMVEKYQPYTPTQDDLNKLQELFEKKYNQTIETDSEVDKELEQYIDLTNEPVSDTVTDTVSDTVTEVITPTPTPSEPLYFVDDEPVIEPQINRLVYSKDV